MDSPHGPTRFLDALYYCVDGNFHTNLKEKRHDDDDFPLTKGAGYFANEDAVGAYLETLGPPGAEVCSDSRVNEPGPDRSVAQYMQRV